MKNPPRPYNTVLVSSQLESRMLEVERKQQKEISECIKKFDQKHWVQSLAIFEMNSRC